MKVAPAYMFDNQLFARTTFDFGFSLSDVGEFPKSDIKNPKYTEGSFDFGFVMSDVGKFPKSDLRNPKYTEGSLFFLFFQKRLIPIKTRFRCALLRRVIHVNQAQTFGVTRYPFKIVPTTPHDVAVNVCTVGFRF
jgi:hypothetical protein